jgi:hypothetical protein
MPLEERKVAEEIDDDRRRLPATAAATVAVAGLGIFGSVGALSGKLKAGGATPGRPGR